MTVISPTILSNLERTMARLEVLTRHLTRADRTLSGEPIQVRVENSPGIQAPAWSNGQSITLNAALLQDIRAIDQLAHVYGLNYHELAHCLFTPRAGTNYAQAVKRSNWRMASNILEDQRIETLLTGMYPAIRPYLCVCVASFNLSQPKSWDLALLCVWGRKYLGRVVLDKAADAFRKPEYVDEIKAIIDEYRLLTFPSNTQRALQLVERFDEILTAVLYDGIIMLSPPDPFGHEEHGVPESVKDGSALKERDQKIAAQDAMDLEYEDEEPIDDDYEDQEGIGNDEGIDGKGSGAPKDTEESSKDDGEGQGDGSGTPTDLESERQGDGDGGDAETPGVASSTPGTGEGEAKPGGADHPADELRKMIENSLNEQEVADTLERLQRSVVWGDGRHDISIDQHPFYPRPVDTADIAQARKFARELLKLRDDMDPGWKPYQDSGNLNIKRVIRGDDPDTVFDSWTEGVNDATDIEAVILLDNSGSMAGQIAQASLAVWTIKKALDLIHASTTVFTFNTNSYILYRSNEQASQTFRAIGASGGTDPGIALREAAMTLDASRRNRKVLFMVSDGIWYADDEIFKRMGAARVTRTFVFIESPFTHQTAIKAVLDSKRHLFDVALPVASPKDLPEIAKLTVKKAMKRPGRTAGHR